MNPTLLGIKDRLFRLPIMKKLMLLQNAGFIILFFAFSNDFMKLFLALFNGITMYLYAKMEER